MDFFDNQSKLFGTAFLLFAVLTTFVAILPAISNEKNNAPLPSSVALTDEAIRGKAIYVSNGCVACHTQQVRNVDMDKVWGARPGIAADYARNTRTDLWRNTATLMGTERTGPDLTSVGDRQPSKEWNLVHLYNPRIVVAESIMPAYPWLFQYKKEATEQDVVVHVPDKYQPESGVLVASQEALDLVAYLQSLRQTELSSGRNIPEFLYPKSESASDNVMGAPVQKDAGLDGSQLYVTYCQACHQANGEGLKGAFPPLKGSKVVLDPNSELMLNIIVKGYDGRPEYGAMPAVGAISKLTAAELAAIMNHEKSSWGNDAPKVSEAEITEMMKAIEILE